MNPFHAHRGGRSAARLVAVLVALLVPAPGARAGTTLVIGAAKDNTLYESATGSLSNGAGTSFFAGRNNQATNSIRRGLLWFNVAAAIPDGATILSVDLELIMSQTSAGAANVGLHRASAAWGEGASDAGIAGGSGAPAQAGDATWKHTFFPGSLWAAAGGDFAAAASATLAVDATGTYVWTSNPGLVADVQAWLDEPASNHGWLLRGNEAIAQTVKKFDSRESTDPTLRPALTITYETPTPAVPATWGRIKAGYR